MKIIVDYKNQNIKILSVDKAKYLGNYTIQIKFNDGSEKSVDFKPFLNKTQHPSIKRYLDEKLFSKFKIINGNLNWNDYDLIFPISDLYNGEIKV